MQLVMSQISLWGLELKKTNSDLLFLAFLAKFKKMAEVGQKVDKSFWNVWGRSIWLSPPLSSVYPGGGELLGPKLQQRCQLFASAARSAFMSASASSTLLFLFIWDATDNGDASFHLLHDVQTPVACRDLSSPVQWHIFYVLNVIHLLTRRDKTKHNVVKISSIFFALILSVQMQ